MNCPLPPCFHTQVPGGTEYTIEERLENNFEVDGETYNEVQVKPDEARPEGTLVCDQEGWRWKSFTLSRYNTFTILLYLLVSTVDAWMFTFIPNIVIGACD